MTREELRNYVDEQRAQDIIPYHVYSSLIDGIDTLEQEPCEDTISRQAVLSYIYNDLGLGDEENGADIERQKELESSYKYVKSLPPVNPQQKIGHWIEISRGFECDQCHGIDTDGLEPPYCKWCGTQMKQQLKKQLNLQKNI